MSRRAHRTLLRLLPPAFASALLLLYGCDRVASFNGAAPATIAGDVTRDAPGDVELLDHSITDTSIDIKASDASVDAGSPRDRGLDLRAVDISGPSDISVPDSTIDSIAVISGCSVGSSAIWSWGANSMVLCRGTGQLIQADAHKFCDLARNWDICTASQYRTRSASAGTHAQTAWIKGCVRNTGAPIAPVNSYCAQNAVSLPQLPIVWPCGGGLPVGQSDSSSVPVVTHTACRRIGVDDGTNEANWTTGTPGAKLPAAVCCK